MNKKYLVTGAAGFIGFHTSMRLVAEGHHVVGIDNVCDYYDVNLKRDRLAELAKLDGFEFREIELENYDALDALFKEQKFDKVINLAAQAGVRLPLTNPHPYVQSNLVGFANILECCRLHPVEHLIYASSSSVYGRRSSRVHSAFESVDHPMSLYAASKRANELMAHSYSHLFNIPTTGLRFFSVYGPWGRPDAAYFIFTKNIIEGKPIKVFNHGEMLRDFTYVDDIVEGVVRISDVIPEAKELDKEYPNSSPIGPFSVFNIGNDQPSNLLNFIKIIESHVGKEAVLEMLPIQPGDVPVSHAEVSGLKNAIDYSPSTSLEQGLGNFVDWYKRYYKPVIQETTSN